MKNWSEARAVTGTTYDQFKQYIISGKEFIYYFSDAARAGMKGKFQDLYKNASKLEELWTANPQYFKQFNPHYSWHERNNEFIIKTNGIKISGGIIFFKMHFLRYIPTVKQVNFT